ncbi:hypothetical protein JTB14_011097 [Gonioctena quinquepunctata]|nr:hypothetical protein JTB14_011097 [Gonioctena quinquepunctata]
MGTTPIECEQRWTVLRNKYATLKRTSKNSPLGSQSYTISWPYYRFLDPFMQRRRTTTNFSVSQSVSQSSSYYSGVQNIINTDSEVEKEGSGVLFDNQENHYDLDQTMEKQEDSMDETQALYENYINKKQLA